MRCAIQGQLRYIGVLLYHATSLSPIRASDPHCVLLGLAAEEVSVLLLYSRDHIVEVPVEEQAQQQHRERRYQQLNVGGVDFDKPSNARGRLPHARVLDRVLVPVLLLPSLLH